MDIVRKILINGFVIILKIYGGNKNEWARINYLKVYNEAITKFKERRQIVLHYT